MPSFVNKPVVNKSQNFNGNEKQQARKNIGAASEEELISHISDTTKHITEAERTKWNAAVQPSQLAKVATTGSYSDLTGKPTIPPAITVDSAMSSTSTNPVQNKVVNGALSGKLNHITDASKITGTIKSFTSWEIPIKYQSGVNGSFVRLWDVTSFRDGSIVNLDNDHVNFKGFFIAGKNQGFGAPVIVEIACKVAYDQSTSYLYSSNKTYGPCICSRMEDGVKKYYLGIYYDSNLYAGQGSSLVGFFASYASKDTFSHKTFLGDNTPWMTYPAQEPLWTREESWTGLVSAKSLFTPRSLGVNLARTAASTFDGSANQLEIPVKGTLPIVNGGTGASTALAAEYNLLTRVSDQLTADAEDTYRILFGSVSPSATTGRIAGYRTCLQLYNYIKGKADSVYASKEELNGKQDALAYTTPAEITEILGGLE